MARAALSAEAALREGPQALFDLLAARLDESVGYGLLTLLAAGERGDRLVRPHSSRPDRYPPGDADPVEDSRWFRRLFVDQEAVVANDEAAIRDWLPEFADEGLGEYESLLNLPVVVAGQVVGLINLMGGRDHFDAGRVEAAKREAPLAALTLLARPAGLPRITLPVRPATGGAIATV